MIKPERKEVISKGLKIVYWRTDYNNKKPIIVFNVGGGMNHTSLLKLEKEFNKKGYSTLNYDMRGVGESDVPKGSRKYSLKDHTEDLLQILKKSKIKNPIFITQSFGFMPVVDYCSKTNNYQTIIGIATSYDFSKGHNPLLMKIVRNIELFIQK